MQLEQLDELYNYKNKLMEDLLTNPDIIKLVNPNVDIDHADLLAYSQVFPFEYVPDTIESGKTFICFDVDIQSVINKTYLSPTLYIWVFTHKSKLHLLEGGVLTDRLCSKIVNTINGSRYYGLGELALHSIKRFAPMTDFQGKVLTFHATDFNRLYNPKKATPTNRRTTG